MPLAFTDEEADAITGLASALPPPARRRFVELVAGRLAAYPQGARGPGLVHRLAAEAQHDFHFAIGGRDRGKYARCR